MDNRTIEQVRDNEDRLIKELQQKENIIKEVREFIEKHNLFSFSENDHDWYDYITDNGTKNELLEILDKEKE